MQPNSLENGGFADGIRSYNYSDRRARGKLNVFQSSEIANSRFGQSHSTPPRMAISTVLQTSFRVRKAVDEPRDTLSADETVVKEDLTVSESRPHFGFRLLCK